MTFLENIVVKYLKETANKIEQGKCELTDDEAIDIMSVIAHQAVSKDEACSIINVNKSRFGELMSKGDIPQGRKRRGWKELRWYKDELLKVIFKRRKQNESLTS